MTGGGGGVSWGVATRGGIREPIPLGREERGEGRGEGKGGEGEKGGRERRRGEKGGEGGEANSS